MESHNGWVHLCKILDISETMDMPIKNRSLYRTYIPTSKNKKEDKRKMLDAMDIYTYLSKNDITKDVIIEMVKTRKAVISEIMGKIK